MNYKILIADVDLNVHIAVKNVALEQFWDLQIFSAYDGRQAVDIVREKGVDMVILSWDLPILSGLQVLQKLEMNFEKYQIPVVVISSPAHMEDAFNAGASDFLIKPIKKTELLIRMKSMLSMSRLIKRVKDQAELLSIKNKVLDDERIKSDALLTNILPTEIAEQLKNKGRVEPKIYKTVSILFTDFEGFTLLSESLKPREIVKELGVFFAKFDQIVGGHFLEKIKTVGDAYMCAGGLPIRNQSNPIDTVLAGLEMQHFAKIVNAQKRKYGELEWNLRVGIHTGKVIAGVVGTSKFSYDIWGDAVNVAARMESSGEVGKVNISGATYEHVKEYFDCEYRGKITAKNKGKIDMYFVNGLKPEYSTKRSNIVPNRKFLAVLAQY